MQRVRVLFPTAWDRQQLLARPELWADAFELVLEAPDDANCRYDFDVLGYIDAAVRDWRGAQHGVFSSSDYPGVAVAAAIGTALALPASDPVTILRAGHKGLARAVQRAQLPAETPSFQVIDPDRLDDLELTVPLPCFVKPAKGSFSVLARRVASEAQLHGFLRDPFVAEYRRDYLRIYSKLVARYLGPDVDGTVFVAEEQLRGQLVTVEGYATDREVHAIGVVDSVCDQRTGSFTGFVYPSVLPASVCRRLEDAACRVARAFELRWTMFNCEFFWDPATDRIGLVEINPRLCGQFADLYEKVDGCNAYRIALDLACGRAPNLRCGAGLFANAASYPMRVFEPVRVARAPDAFDIAAARQRSPQARVWNEVRTGEVLSDFATSEDGQSYRYAVINVGAAGVGDLVVQRDAVLERLGYRFAR
ncbi:MAG: ATP-grasp domain-containing protein [Planctomycetota bacterium]